MHPSTIDLAGRFDATRYTTAASAQLGVARLTPVPRSETASRSSASAGTTALPDPTASDTVVPYDAPGAVDFANVLQAMTAEQPKPATKAATATTATTAAQPSAAAPTQSTTQSGTAISGQAATAQAPSSWPYSGQTVSPYQGAVAMAYMLVPVMELAPGTTVQGAPGTSSILAPATTASGVQSATSTGSAATLQLPFSGNYPITQGFGPTTLTIEPSYEGYAHFHTGIDYALPQDTPVTAAGSGKVIAAGWDSSGFGNRVEIDQGNGVVTLYGHLDKLSVKVGDAVSAGQQIGLSGDTGNSTGPHLHFGVEKDGTWVDPTQYLGSATDGSQSTTSTMASGSAGTVPPTPTLGAAGLGYIPAVGGTAYVPAASGSMFVPAANGAVYLVPVMAMPAGFVPVASAVPGTVAAGQDTGIAPAPGAATSGPNATPSSDAAPGGTTAQTLSPQALQTMIQGVAKSTGVSNALISAVVQTESGGNPLAVSSAGAKGLMQLMDSTATYYGVTNSFDPEQNLTAGATYLHSLLEQFGGDEQLALAAYNAGPGAVETYGGVPPYPETQSYVQRVQQLEQVYSSEQ